MRCQEKMCISNAKNLLMCCNASLFPLPSSPLAPLTLASIHLFKFCTNSSWKLNFRCISWFTNKIPKMADNTTCEPVKREWTDKGMRFATMHQKERPREAWWRAMMNIILSYRTLPRPSMRKIGAGYERGWKACTEVERWDVWPCLAVLGGTMSMAKTMWVLAMWANCILWEIAFSKWVRGGVWWGQLGM